MLTKSLNMQAYPTPVVFVSGVLVGAMADETGQTLLDETGAQILADPPAVFPKTLIDETVATIDDETGAQIVADP